jgi:peptide chain release factor 2
MFPVSARICAPPPSACTPPDGRCSVLKVVPLPVLDLTDFKRDLSELTDRLGHAQDCL